MGWFKRGLPQHQTALAMVGARPGDRVLFLGAGAAALAAEVALVTGLNGRTVVAGTAAGARERVERAAADAGALVEWEDASPAAIRRDDDGFDIAVIAIDPAAVPSLARLAADAGRVLRPGGRIVVRLQMRRSLFGGSNTPDDAVLDLLRSTGVVAVRHLADDEGVSYFEARKARVE